MNEGNQKAANINATQAITMGSLLMLIVVVSCIFRVFLFYMINLFPYKINSFFGGSAILYPLLRDYIIGVSGELLFVTINFISMFIIRLDSSPKYAMLLNIVATNSRIICYLSNILGAFDICNGIFI